MNVPNANASTMPSMDTSQAAPTAAQAPIGPPPMHTFTPNPLENQTASNAKARRIVGGALGLGLLVVGVGMFFGGHSRSAGTQHSAVVMPGFSRTGEQRSGPRDPATVAKDDGRTKQDAAVHPSDGPSQQASGESPASHGE